MDYDDIRRAKITEEVSAQIESILTISLAFKAAAKFSNGASITEGEGLLGKSKRGTFNICYWVRVEGSAEQWVVRFPLIGMLPMDVMTAKFSCEIATLKFLHEKTSVRVPKLIGYSLGDDDIPIPFMITQNVQGLPLSVYWGRFSEDPTCVERILDSLAQQYLELLSHPFDRLGSLRLTADGQGWEIGTSPISVDQFDASRDGLKITLSEPHTTSLEYYTTQTHVFERYTNEQRNSVYSDRDGILKYLAPELFRRVIPHFINGRFNNGPFYLFHFDLHANNVITNRQWQVEAILDWEFTSTMPIEVACSPPRCIMDRYRVDEMRLDSNNYTSYEARLRIFTGKVRKHLADSYSDLSQLAHVILTHLDGALSERRAFFAWSASDIRYMFHIVWKHLALTTPVTLEHEDNIPPQNDVVFESRQKLIDEMVRMIGEEKVHAWVEERLMSLHEYELERVRLRVRESDN